MTINKTHQTLWQVVDRQRQEYVDVLQTLVRVSRDGEAATQQHVARRLKELGGRVETISHRPGRLDPAYELAGPGAADSAKYISVIGQWSGSGQGRTLLLFAHPDSEPVAGTEAWHFDPFAAEIKNGRLYGWGVADDLLGIAAMLAGVEALLAAGQQPAGPVILASTPSKRHVRGILAVLDQGYEADGAVYLHPAESGAGLQDVKATTLGILQFRIKVLGQPPGTQEPNHTPFYHLAVDPIAKVWVIYQALQLLAAERARKIDHPAIAAAVGQATNLQVAYLKGGQEQTLHRVSSEAVLAGSVTFPPNEKMADVQTQIIEAVATAAQGDPWLSQHPPQLEWLMGTSGVEVPTDSLLYQTVHQAIRAVTGLEPAVHPLHTASDIRHPLLYKGIPTVGFGSLAGNLTQAGYCNEWIDVEDYISMVKVVASIITEWCGGYC